MLTKGSLGEALAEQFLVARGFRVLGRNVRAGRREIDLVVEKGSTVVLVEVKFRRRDSSEAWRRAQKARAGEAALTLMEQWPGRTVRFDLVTIEEEARGWTLRHYPGAWAPKESFW
jgi:putative endonuclease